MRVGVDARHLTGGRGVAHYTSALLAALAERFPEDEWVALAPGRGPLVGRHPPNLRIVRGRLPSRLLFGAAALTARPTIDALAGGDVDVVWIPAPAPVAVSGEVPYVLTVHDLSWVEHPEWFTRYERVWHRVGRLERLAREAATVVAVSDATRRAILRHWPAVRDVEVVHSGIPPLPPPATERPAWLPRPYFLAVGALEPRKAPDVLAAAFAQARAQGLDADLVFAGHGRLAAALRGEDVHVVEDADAATLSTLYAHALALALPSRLEGFGFTALEAARAGTPVLAAAGLDAVEETLGDAARSVGDWPAALLEVAADEALRNRMAEAGREAARRYDWGATSDRTRALLAQAASR